MFILRWLIIGFFIFAGGLGLKEHFIDGKEGALQGGILCLGIAGILWLLAFFSKRSKKRRDLTSNLHAGAMAAHIIGGDQDAFEAEQSSGDFE